MEIAKTLKEIVKMPNIVKVYSIGSSDCDTRIGKYYAVLEFNNKCKAITGELVDTTTNRCIIQGLIEAIKLIKKPCEILIITSTAIGIKNAFKNKGTNIDLIRELLAIIKEKMCDPEFIALEGQGADLNKYIFTKSL